MASQNNIRATQKPSVVTDAKSKTKAMSSPELVAIKLRNDFYKDSYKNNRLMMIVLLCAIGVSMTFNFILFSVKPQVRVIAVDENGRMIPVVSTLEPMHKDSNVNNWIASTVVDLNTYDFRNWRKHFQEMQERFTDRGWQSYSAAMERSRTINLVTSDQVLVSSLTAGAPVITDKGPYQGRFAWRIEFPLTVTYEGASDSRVQKLLITAVVVRSDDLIRHENGLAIEQIVSREM